MKRLPFLVGRASAADARSSKGEPEPWGSGRVCASTLELTPMALPASLSLAQAVDSTIATA